MASPATLNAVQLDADPNDPGAPAVDPATAAPAPAGTDAPALPASADPTVGVTASVDASTGTADAPAAASTPVLPASDTPPSAAPTPDDSTSAAAPATTADPAAASGDPVIPPSTESTPAAVPAPSSTDATPAPATTPAAGGLNVIVTQTLNGNCWGTDAPTGTIGFHVDPSQELPAGLVITLALTANGAPVKIAGIVNGPQPSGITFSDGSVSVPITGAPAVANFGVQLASGGGVSCPVARMVPEVAMVVTAVDGSGNSVQVTTASA
ncbi:hypothetical protein HK101_001717 [Irineochytrium annulatum]|nr:hypothetical protein HK101_001717 [Irineochytrium annulatum]